MRERTGKEWTKTRVDTHGAEERERRKEKGKRKKKNSMKKKTSGGPTVCGMQSVACCTLGLHALFPGPGSRGDFLQGKSEEERRRKRGRRRFPPCPLACGSRQSQNGAAFGFPPSFFPPLPSFAFSFLLRVYGVSSRFSLLRGPAAR